MKSTFQMGRPARRGDLQHQFGFNLPKSPAIDWSFQSPATQILGGGGSHSIRHHGARPKLLRSFRGLSEGFFASEAKRESRLEGALFAVIAVLAVWPMVLAAQAAAGLLK
jgi:hypothetical protein